MSIREDWKKAKEPDYGDGLYSSKDMGYKYSDSEYREAIPKKDLISDVILIDFWGEGYIDDKGFKTGFQEAYNVNYQYQLVSNGPNKGRKIPNRIPTKDYYQIGLGNYIKDSAAQYITLMGAPLEEKEAREISRILHKKKGTFIYFEKFDSEKEFENKKNIIHPFFYNNNFCFLKPDLYKKLERKFDNRVSIEIGLVYMATDKLLSCLKEKSAAFNHEDIAGFLKCLYQDNRRNQWQELIHYLISDNQDTKLLSSLNILSKQEENARCVYDFTMFISGKGNILYYIYESKNTHRYLYEFFRKWYHNIVMALFEGAAAMIKNAEFDMYLKLPVNMVDKDQDKPAFGGAADRGIEKGQEDRFSWKFIPKYVGKKEACFEIYNQKFEMPLKLPVKMVDRDDDKPVYGGCKKRGIETDSTERFCWELRSVSLYDTIFFTITNKAFRMPLKLPKNLVDRDGDKPAYGGAEKRGIEKYQEKRFYWYIETLL